MKLKPSRILAVLAEIARKLSNALALVGLSRSGPKPPTPK